MKWLIRIGIPLLALAGCIYGDVEFGKLLFSHLPADASWLFWAKCGIGIGIFWFTVGFIIMIVVVAGAIAMAVTEDD